MSDELTILDFSSWQPGIRWREVPPDAADGAISKATEGDDYTNPEYAAQIAGTRAIGWEAGHYLFARLERTTAAREIGKFAATADVRDGEPVAIDVEEIFRDANGNARIYDLSDLVGERCELLAAQTKGPVGIYTYPWYKNAYGLNNPKLTKYWLWYAQVDPPTWPIAASVAPWDDATLHQYTTSLVLPGIPGESVDASHFRGDRAAFRALGRQAGLVPPVLDLSKPDPVTGHTVHPYFWAAYDFTRHGRPLGPACAYTDSDNSDHPGWVRQEFERVCLGSNGRGEPIYEGLGQAYTAATGRNIVDWPTVHPLVAAPTASAHPVGQPGAVR